MQITAGQVVIDAFEAVKPKEMKLTPSDRALLFSLKRKYFSFKKNGKLDKDGAFYYDDKRLAYEEYVSESTILRAKRKLCDQEYIRCEVGKHKGLATRYWILAKGIKMLPFRQSQRVANCLAKGIKMADKGYQNDIPNIVINKETKHPFLPTSYYQEILKEKNKDEFETKEHFLSEGYTEFQIEDAKRSL